MQPFQRLKPSSYRLGITGRAGPISVEFVACDQAVTIHRILLMRIFDIVTGGLLIVFAWYGLYHAFGWWGVAAALAVAIFRIALGKILIRRRVPV